MISDSFSLISVWIFCLASALLVVFRSSVTRACSILRLMSLTWSLCPGLWPSISSDLIMERSLSSFWEESDAFAMGWPSLNSSSCAVKSIRCSTPSS